MKTIIVYSTKYGTTEKCANSLSKKLSGEIDLVNLKSINDIDLSLYERVIIGGSIYLGRIQKEVTNFCSNNLEALKEKKLGLFICCMRDGNEMDIQLKAAFPQELVDKAIAIDAFGGEFIFDKMGFIDRFIVKKVSKTDKDTSNILETNIVDFSELMNNA
ncbi:flavodoxin domain-containing protein [Alkaliphilus peptidifermentans]|uniref:Menaquinone-dependent protoporphyrinogen oxidase n=1 Tax=Alkaliphilus peptidifermentans DSM 18978 TaxID=1120976 RepID=A0A1G5JR47_9FIRM|nr:flavodoxin domain-containing protein [Alkaliphilus peptidifermentans]SCY90797.1 menaquinone-dependent protoporphyrinogen oxidase [Alkaliphilus peptidifermentans DSM 18978]